MTNSKNKFIINIVLVVFFNLLLLLLVIFLWRAADLKRNLVLDIKKQLALYERRIDHINRLEETLRRTKENYSKIESMFIEEDSMVSFIEELESLAKNADVNLKIKGIRFVGEQDKKPVFTLVISGSFKDIYYYFTLLENMIYKIEFDKASIEKFSETEGWESFLELRLLSFKNA